MKKIKVGLIGLGPHAKRIHLHYFKKHSINFSLLVELEHSKTESYNYLKEHEFFETDIWSLPDRYKDDEYLPKRYEKQLLEKIQKLGITHLIISTEPKAHHMYLYFALKYHIHVLTDKPITVLKDMNLICNIEKMREQYDELMELYEVGTTNCMVLCQRQYHRGYLYIENLIREMIMQYNIPITYIQIYHCDGKWMMPHDLNCENHPYKYGYGKLFHSGYHFIDLLCRFIKLNDLTTIDKHYQEIEMYNTFFTPEDELTVFNRTDYKNIFHNQKIPDFYYQDFEPNFQGFGEKNFYSTLTFRNNFGRVITTAQLNLLQTGFSRRGWIQTKPDHYKGNGRIRHEMMNIQLGPLMNIQVHSYQSKEIKDRTDSKIERLPGGLEHFDIDIYRNVDLIGGKPYERIHLYDLYNMDEKNNFLGYNEYAREEMIDAFFKGDIKRGDLRDQELAIELLYQACISLQKRKEGEKDERISKLSRISRNIIRERS